MIGNERKIKESKSNIRRGKKIDLINIGCFILNVILLVLLTNVSNSMLKGFIRWSVILIAIPPLATS